MSWVEFARMLLERKPQPVWERMLLWGFVLLCFIHLLEAGDEALEVLRFLSAAV